MMRNREETGKGRRISWLQLDGHNKLAPCQRSKHALIRRETAMRPPLAGLERDTAEVLFYEMSVREASFRSTNILD